MSSVIQLMFMDAASSPQPELERELLPRLHAAEQARYHSFTHARRRRTWLTGRALLLAALARRSEPVDATALRTDTDGSVLYRDGALHLSLSHCRDLLVATLASTRSGVDIEWLRPRALLRRADRVFSQAEADGLHDLSTAGLQDAFYTLWTLKEAASKAAGVMLWESLHNACFDLASGGFTAHAPFPSGDWRFMSACVEPGWRVSVAAMHAAQRLRVEAWRLTGARGWREQTLSRQVFLQTG